MKSSIISIIVPVYKVEKYLRNCIESVINQSYENWELILIDDGSPDNCPAICDEYVEKDNRITVIHKNNGGLSSARNVGLKLMKGDYVTFLDSDDFWQREYLERLLILCINEQADIAQCEFVRGSALTFPVVNKMYTFSVFNNHSIFLTNHAKIIVCAKLYKRSIWKGITMPEGKINEDDFTTWKLYYRASKIVTTSEPLYYYTFNENSIMSKQEKKPRLDFLEAYAERISYFESLHQKDMIDYSRKQFCKALLLISSNSYLTEKQKITVRALFLQHWKCIRHSQYINILLKMLFYFYQCFPLFCNYLIHKIKKSG